MKWLWVIKILLFAVVGICIYLIVTKWDEILEVIF